MGSCLSIFLSLGAVLVMYLLLGERYPRLQAEFSPLMASLLIFLVLTAISGLSFYSLLIGHAWRRAAQGLMWLGILVAGFYYWP